MRGVAKLETMCWLAENERSSRFDGDSEFFSCNNLFYSDEKLVGKSDL